jgi:hypothetical protein
MIPQPATALLVQDGLPGRQQRPAKKTPRHKLLALLLECCQLKNFISVNLVPIDETQQWLLPVYHGNVLHAETTFRKEIVRGVAA